MNVTFKWLLPELVIYVVAWIYESKMTNLMFSKQNHCIRNTIAVVLKTRTLWNGFVNRKRLSFLREIKKGLISSWNLTSTFFHESDVVFSLNLYQKYQFCKSYLFISNSIGSDESRIMVKQQNRIRQQEIKLMVWNEWTFLKQGSSLLNWMCGQNESLIEMSVFAIESIKVLFPFLSR